MLSGFSLNNNSIVHLNIALQVHTKIGAKTDDGLRAQLLGDIGFGRIEFIMMMCVLGSGSRILQVFKEKSEHI